MGLCKYSAMFGAAQTGVHSHRLPIVDLAIVDVVGTFGLAWLVQVVFGIRAYWKALGLTFLAGIIAHRLFCVPTTVDKLLFGTS